jgi:alkylation response protein AidB-like acyl-CoA dehydrogenase
MDIDLGPELSAFREEMRDWIEEHRLDGLVDLDERALYFSGMGLSGRAAEALQVWTERLLQARLICPQWPAEVGGRALRGLHMAVLNEEFHRARVPRVTRGMGESLVGPSIIVHGTAEQKAYFLPRIVSGEDRYCQGFSEPNHGSDLAGVETRGVVDGDEIVISGQKVWTSGAHLANRMFLVCRTDPSAPKHRGLSYVLVAMNENGIEIRPLRQANGASGFSQEYIEDCRAPLFNVIGGLHNGWRVAMTTLGNERGGQATTQHLRYEREFWELVDEARKRGRSTDPLVRQDLAWAYSQVELMRYQGLRLLSTLAAKREPGPEASVSKLFWSEYHKRLGEIAVNVLGPESMIATTGQESTDYTLDRWQMTFVSSRAGTIFSGTSQIQRNIIGERALGLPKEPAAG